MPEPVTDAESLWVARFTGGRAGSAGSDVADQLLVARAAEAVEKQAAQQLHLEQLRRDVARLTDQLRAAFAIKVDMINGKAEMDLISADQTEAFDWREDGKDLDTKALIQSGYEEKMSEAKIALTLLEQRMLDLRFTQSRIVDRAIVRDEQVALFTEADLTDELYTPLVREQLLPEAFVEDAFSRVQQMINTTNDAYIKELETISETAERDENIKLAKEVVSAMASIATDAVGIEKATGGVDKDQAKMINGYIKLAQASINTTMDLGANIADGDYRKGLSGAVSSMAKSAGFAVTQATGSKAAGKYVTAAMSAAVGVDKLVKAVQDSNTDNFLKALTDMVGVGFDFASVKADDATGEKLSTAAVATNAALKTLLAAKKADLLKAVQDGQWGKLRTVLVTSVSQAARAEFASKFPEKISDTDKNVDKIADKLAEISKELEASPEAKAAAEAKAALEEAEKQNVEEKLREERKEFEETLRLLGQREVLDAAEIKSISKLIADLKRDRAVMDAAISIGKSGAAVAKEFVAPLAIAGTLISFTTTLAAAVDRAIAWRKWLEANREALATASPYLTSIQNFVKNQHEQFTHKSISAALLLLQVAAQVTAAAGTGTPVQAVATVVDKGLSMALTLEELVYTVYQRSELEKAWAITRRALDDPSNRKANLIARRQNATLAKYSIAYGAVEARDVIAISALNKIGLNQETLAQPDAKLGSVKEYLEQLYSDDTDVKRRYVKDTGWSKGLPEPALAPRPWMMTVEAARAKAQLTSPHSDAINRLLTQAADQLTRCESARAGETLTPDDAQELAETLERLHEAFGGFTITTTSGARLPDLETLIGGYQDLAVNQAGEVQVWRTEAIERLEHAP